MDIREENIYYNQVWFDDSVEIIIIHDRSVWDYLKSYLFFVIRIITIILIPFILVSLWGVDIPYIN